MTSLAHLSLFANKLSGAIPIDIGEMKSLTNLELSRNFFTGTVPPSLGKLSRAEWLVLGENQLTGAIPPELGGLTALTRFLNLANNELSGPSQQFLCRSVNTCLPGYAKTRDSHSH